MKDILREIIKENDASNRSRVFSTYKNKAEIGKLILDTLIAKKYSRKQNNKGFFMAENEKGKIGIITHCLGLQTIALSKDYDVELFQGNKNSDEYLQIINDSLVSIFTLLEVTDEKVETILKGELDKVEFTYDASPYIYNDDMDDETLELTNYVDTIAKVLETFVEFRNFYYKNFDNGFEIKVEKYENLANYIDAIIIKSMRDLNDACIECESPIEYKINNRVVKDKFEEDCHYKGWNYVKMDSSAEPSLYFSYAVCSSYMAFVGNFTFVIKAVRKLEESMTVEEKRAKICPKIPETKKISFERNVRFFEKIYKEYVDFNKRCLDCGHYVDMQVEKSKIDITQNFVGLGFNEVTVQELLNSTTNDALINTVFVLLIAVYSGLDLDYEAYDKGEDFNDRLQYAVQNILKVYKMLERENKNFIVDQCILSFNEKMPSSLNEQIKILRKQRILVASLMPLLIKAYTSMSKYIIKYPQKQMKDYLRIILENRTYDRHNNNQLWIWDKEGYNISINLYYILNLLDFYTYYENYELPYTNDEETFTYKLEKQQEEHEKTVKDLKEDYEKQVEFLQNEIENKDRKISELRPIEKEVVAISKAYLEENIQKIIADAFKEAREDTIDNGTANELSKSFKAMFNAMFAKEIRESIDKGRINKDQKLSENPIYNRYEKSMFAKFEEWMIDRMRKEEGLDE